MVHYLRSKLSAGSAHDLFFKKLYNFYAVHLYEICYIYIYFLKMSFLSEPAQGIPEADDESLWRY